MEKSETSVQVKSKQIFDENKDDCTSSEHSNLVKQNGWGFFDTSLNIGNDGNIFVTGNRYLFSGIVLPHFKKWAEDEVGLNITKTSTPQKYDKIKLSKPILNQEFLNDIKGKYKYIFFGKKERILHSHGHSCQDIQNLRYAKFLRSPDVIIYPGEHNHVEAIVRSAINHNVVIIPYGGGTNVSAALECPNDSRMIVSLDMHEMNQINQINYKNMTASIQAGAIGRNIERKLLEHGLTMGHEPDSSEFSSLGGQISTRASGMMKNKYGNIEDIVKQISIVTPSGTFKRCDVGPRVSIGPDINQFILGSEGIFGVITEAVVKIHKLPELTKYGSILFPNFESGVYCLHEIARKRCAPVSIRLVDNNQFRFGQALKSAPHSKAEAVIDKMKKLYVTKALKFDPNQMVVATLKFIGTSSDVTKQNNEVFEIAKKYGGYSAGEENGKRGYFLTFMIAYIRDFAFNYNFISESFETSVPQSHCLALCRNVKTRILQSCKNKGVKSKPFVSCRISQTYDSGACVYFYFGFIFDGLKNPISIFSEVEKDARDCILENNGSLSHHHGVGKHRKKWIPKVYSEFGVKTLKGLKNTIDPKNIFANGNLI